MVSDDVRGVIYFFNRLLDTAKEHQSMLISQDNRTKIRQNILKLKYKVKIYISLYFKLLYNYKHLLRCLY